MNDSSLSLNDVLKTHTALYEKAFRLVAKKGQDYNRAQQENGDTIFNLRVARLLGVVKTDEQSIIVRMTDKLMRLISLTTSEEIPEPACDDEKVEDTIVDLINYAVYLYAVFNKRAGIERGEQLVVDEMKTEALNIEH